MNLFRGYVYGAGDAAPTVVVHADKADKASEDNALNLEISSPGGLARVQWNGQTDPTPSPSTPASRIVLREKDLEARFSREKPLHLSVLGMNAKERTVRDVWRLFSNGRFVRVPGTTDYVLNKCSVMAKSLEDGDEDLQGKLFWTWATMLQKRKEDGSGSVTHAYKVEVRTGGVLDGAYVYYEDESRVNCGPRVGRNKYRGKRHEHSLGGESEAVDISGGQDIVKVEVSREADILRGIRFTLSNGKTGGQLSDGGPPLETLALEPAENEQIVGFYGRSYWGEYFDGLVEFGIFTAPKGVELPKVVYTMTELQNIDGGKDVSDFIEDEVDDGMFESCASDTDMMSDASGSENDDEE